MHVFDLRHLRLPLRIAAISDTHGPLDPQVAEFVHGCDLVVHAGDIGGAEGLDIPPPRCAAPIAVRGNNDVPEKWPAEQRGALLSLPHEAILLLPGGDLVVVHGHRDGAPRARHAHLRRRFPAARAVLYGHSHRQVLDRETAPWVLNPGAAGRVRTYGGPGCLLLHLEHDRWRVEAFRFPPPAAAPKNRPR